MKPIRVGQVITKVGNAQREEVKYLKQETKVSIKIKQGILTEDWKQGKHNLKRLGWKSSV